MGSGCSGAAEIFRCVAIESTVCQCVCMCVCTTYIYI